MTEPRDTTPHDDDTPNDDVDLSAAPAPVWESGLDAGYEEPMPEEPKAPRTLKGAAIVSARLVTGLIGLAVAAAALAAAIFLPLPTVSASPPAVTVTPSADSQQRVCAGPLLRLGDDTGAQATTASPLGDPTVTIGVNEGSADETVASSENGAGADILSLSDGDGDADADSLLAGSQSQSVSTGDFVGTAAAECLESRDDTWLVGGATTTGRTTLLTIVNPGEVTATVDITVYSDAGAVSAPGTSGIAIPPGEQRVYSVAGLAPGLASPVVRVESEGGLVVASLQQSTVRTLDPGGLDIVTSTAAPSTDLTIPGIVFPGREALEEAITGEDHLDLNSALRFFVPGEDQAHATVTMVPLAEAGGEAAGDPIDISVTLDPGRVTELPVAEFEAGRYAATITSDEPIVAGVRTAVVNDDGENDFVWLPAVEALDDVALVAVARGLNPVLTLMNPGDAAAEVVLTRGDAERTIDIPARAGVYLTVAQGVTYGLSGAEGIGANVGFRGDGTVAAHTVSPRAPTSSPIVVYP
jgi:hypothetical protein